MDQVTSAIPAWLTQDEDYTPPRDRDRFIARSILSVTSVLAHLRIDDGTAARISPSAPAKLIFGFGCILLTSLSSNYFFTIIMLAGVLARLCILPAKALRRCAGVAFGAAALSLLVMLPAIFLGQPHSALLVASKVLVSVSIAMTVALSTPFNELTGALRAFHVPAMFIMTIDLALKNIVSLGRIALETLTALKLRSIGCNKDKGSSIGGVGGVVFLKAQESAQATYAAMHCRGFEGDYVISKEKLWRKADIIWFALLACIIAVFVYLQGLM